MFTGLIAAIPAAPSDEIIAQALSICGKVFWFEVAFAVATVLVFLQILRFFALVWAPELPLRETTYNLDSVFGF
jgi:hypothetical protein